MEVQINTFAIIGSVIVAMMVGGLWYSKLLFEDAWMSLQKIDPKKMKEGSGKAMLGMALGSLAMAYILAHVTYFSYTFFSPDITFLSAALSSAFWMWLGFILPTTASNSLFNQAPWKLTLIHMGNWLVTLLAMGLVIGLIGV